MLPEPAFRRAVSLERKRAERSRKPFVLMFVERRERRRSDGRDEGLERAAPAVLGAIRETDVAGWQRERRTLGVIFAEVGDGDKATILETLRLKMTTALRRTLAAEEVAALSLSFYFFPDDWQPGDRARSLAALYPDLAERDDALRASHALKRAIDVLGSAAAILLLLPVLIAVALAVKLTSRGPVFFRQTRMGQYGRPFTCLKFRSMQAACDPQVHKDYVTRFIAGDPAPSGAGTPVYKLTRDARLTSVGGFLRQTSLDELPQFFNVVRGDMSLVGPRPPIPYEFEAYDVWHRRRLLEVKPGITGLWQVNGRSRLRFDDMVRLDLRYATTWSLWLDVKILLRTPYAVFSGKGAH